MADTGYPKSKRQSICLILFFNLIQFLFVKMNLKKKKQRCTDSEHINMLQILPVIYIKEKNLWYFCFFKHQGADYCETILGFSH